MRKIYFLGILFFFLLVGVNTSLAYSICEFSPCIWTATSTFNLSIHQDFIDQSLGSQEIIQSFIPQSNLINGFGFSYNWFYDPAAISEPIRLYLCQGTPSTTQVALEVDCTNHLLIYSQNFLTHDYAGAYSAHDWFFFDMPLEVVPGQNYYVGIHSLEGGTPRYKNISWGGYYPTNEFGIEHYADGEGCTTDMTGANRTCWPHSDANFAVYTPNATSSTSTFSAYINEPSPGQTGNSEFWNVPFQFKGRINLDPYQFPDEIISFQWQLWDYDSTSTIPLIWTNFEPYSEFSLGWYGQRQAFNYVFSAGNYGVRVRAFDESSEFISPWSATTTFSVTGGFGQAIENQCPADSAFYTSCFWTNLLMSLFVPTASSFSANSWTTLLATLNTKAPFSYLTTIFSDVQNLSAGTTTSLTYNMTFNLSGTNVPFNLGIMPASGGWRTAYDTYFRPLLVFMVWGMVLLYLYERIIHLWDTL